LITPIVITNPDQFKINGPQNIVLTENIKTGESLWKYY